MPLADRRTDVLVAPPLAIGASGEHQSFPGTLSIGTEAMTRLRRWSWPAAPCRTADQRCPGPFTRGAVRERPRRQRWRRSRRQRGSCARSHGVVGVWHPRVVDGDPHAGAHRDLADAAPVPRRGSHGSGRARNRRPVLARSRTGCATEGLAAVTANGVLGDPTDGLRADGSQTCSRRWSTTWWRRPTRWSRPRRHLPHLSTSRGARSVRPRLLGCLPWGHGPRPRPFPRLRAWPARARPPSDR